MPSTTCPDAERVIAQAQRAADRAYLQGMLNGTVELLSEVVFPTVAPMFTRYTEGSEMFALLEKAAEVFGDAVQDVAARALASWAIDEAHRKARGAE